MKIQTDTLLDYESRDYNLREPRYMSVRKAKIANAQGLHRSKSCR
jgi:hypothetical protein